MFWQPVTLWMIRRWEILLRCDGVYHSHKMRSFPETKDGLAEAGDALCGLCRPNCGFPFFRKDFLSYLAQAGGWGWLQGGGAALHLSREEQCTTSRKWRDVEEKGWIRVRRETRYHPSVRWPLSTCRIPRREEDWGGLEIKDAFRKKGESRTNSVCKICF